MSRILIIEDEVAIADLERDYLELSGFTVEIENTGDVGLASCRFKCNQGCSYQQTWHEICFTGSDSLLLS